jgi:hypothetical protein
VSGHRFQDVKTEQAAGFGVGINRKPRHIEPGYRIASVGPPFSRCENGTGAGFRGPIRINVCGHRFQDVKTGLAAGFGAVLNRKPRTIDGFGVGINRKPRYMAPGYRLASVGPPFSRCDDGTSASFRGPNRINVCGHRFQDVKTGRSVGFGAGVNRKPRNIGPEFGIASVWPPFSRCENGTRAIFRGPIRLPVCGHRFQNVKTERAAGFGVGINRNPGTIDPVFRIASVFKM